MIKLKILSENRDDCQFKGESGLSVLVEAFGEKFLLDTGYSDLFMKNAELMGIEDAELLKMAEKVLGREAVLELVKPVAKDMVNYTSSSSTLQNQRIAIAEALMAASK